MLGWVLLGEVDKIVMVSTRRFQSINSEVGLKVAIAAAPGEVVNVATLPPGVRSRPIITQCVAPKQMAFAGGDFDVALTLVCNQRLCACSQTALN
jgi:hypothetical protein